DEFVPETTRKPVVNRVWRVSIALLVIAALAALWRWTPLRDIVSLSTAIAMARALEESAFTPLVVLAAYVIAGLVVFPVTVLIAVSGIIFGPLVGGLYAMSGSLLSAAVTYAIGRRMGRHAVRRLAGARLNRI